MKNLKKFFVIVVGVVFFVCILFICVMIYKRESYDKYVPYAQNDTIWHSKTPEIHISINNLDLTHDGLFAVYDGTICMDGIVIDVKVKFWRREFRIYTDSDDNEEILLYGYIENVKKNQCTFYVSYDAIYDGNYRHIVLIKEK